MGTDEDEAPDEARGARGPEGVAAAPAARMPTARAEVFMALRKWVVWILRGSELWWREINKDASEGVQFCEKQA